MNHQIQNIDPCARELHDHPLLKTIPRWDDTEAFGTLCDDVRDNGVLEPIKLTKGNAVVDGRHRWRAAKRMQLKTIPAVIVEDADAAQIAVSTLLHRRHLTPGQRAYLLADIIGEAFEEARKRRAMNAAKNERNSVSFVSKTPDEWAAEIGVSVQYLRYARELHEWFAEHPEKRTFTDGEGKKVKDVTLRKYFEERILRDEKPMGLGAALAGIGFIFNAAEKNGGKPKDQDRQLDLFNRVLADENNRWEYWQKFNEAAKAEHFKAVRVQAAQLDAKVCEERAEYHARLAAEFRKAAKQSQEAK